MSRRFNETEIAYQRRPLVSKWNPAVNRSGRPEQRAKKTFTGWPEEGRMWLWAGQLGREGRGLTKQTQLCRFYTLKSEMVMNKWNCRILTHLVLILLSRQMIKNLIVWPHKKGKHWHIVTFKSMCWTNRNTIQCFPHIDFSLGGPHRYIWWERHHLWSINHRSTPPVNWLHLHTAKLLAS